MKTLNPSATHSPHLLWVNDDADFSGGCETYIFEVASMLRRLGYRQSLLYRLDRPCSAKFLTPFDAAFPLVEPAAQIKSLNPELIYVHRVQQLEVIRAVLEQPVPKIRFLHDHRLFCLREHKYTTIGQHTCTRTTGLNCYSCLGFAQRGTGVIPIAFRTLGSLRTEQRLVSKFDLCLVGSDYFRQHAIEHGLQPNQVRRVEMFARHRKLDSLPARETQRLLFIGSLVRAKGLHVLLKALSQVHAGWHLDVVGTGRQSARLQQLAAHLGIAAQVDFLGQLSAEEVTAQLHRATALVLPSITPETFGLVGVEALQAGTPVIASDVGGIRQWHTPGETGWIFPSGDDAALASAIHQAIACQTLTRAMGEIGRNRSLTRWTPEIHLAELLQLFAELGLPVLDNALSRSSPSTREIIEVASADSLPTSIHANAAETCEVLA